MNKKVVVLSLLVLFSSISVNANAEEVGGYAVVNPETGTVHGVIVATSSDPFKNGGTMPMEYMGCPVGCIIVQQSTADRDGNVSGKFTHAETSVIYNSGSGKFEVTESNPTQNQVVTESASNTSAVETVVSVSPSVRNYEFSLQDFRNSTGQFEMTEVVPPQNTGTLISATTNEYSCEESALICSASRSTISTNLIYESVSFSERSTSSQVSDKVISEAKNKVREQIGLILLMLKAWVLD